MGLVGSPGRLGASPGVQDRQRFADHGRGEVLSNRVFPGDVGLSAGGTVVPAHARHNPLGDRDHGADPADLGDQLGHHVLTGARVIQDDGLRGARRFLPANTPVDTATSLAISKTRCGRALAATRRIQYVNTDGWNPRSRPRLGRLMTLVGDSIRGRGVRSMGSRMRSG